MDKLAMNEKPPEPLSQKELSAFMDGLTAYLSSEAPETERLATALAIAQGKLTEESIAPGPKREPATEKELIDEISDIQKIFADQAQKREFTVEIITELITPVVVEAFTQEEAEHLALEKFKMAAGDGQRETSESLARLWEVIGVGGSRLILFNKLAFITALTNLAWKQSFPTEEGLNLWSTLLRQWDNGSLAEIPEATPPLTADNLEEVFSAITLSERDCWQAIAEIAAAQAEAVGGEQ